VGDEIINRSKTLISDYKKGTAKIMYDPERKEVFELKGRDFGGYMPSIFDVIDKKSIYGGRTKEILEKVEKIECKKDSKSQICKALRKELKKN
jgi:hypothetical protein